jgi:hypothetical protein
LTESAPRQVNTRYGQKTVWDIKSQDGRRFQSWDQGTGMQAQNLAGQQVRVIYVEKPSSDPQYPPNLQLESIQPLGLPGPGAAAVAVPAQAPQAAPQQAPAAQPAPAAAQPLPAAQATPGAGSSGPSAEDKASMRRSAAVKAGAYLCAGDPEIDFWRLVDQILTFIETGKDPIPFLNSDAESSQQTGQQDEFPPGF